MLVIVLPSLQLLNIRNINSKSKDNNLHQSNVKADIAKTSQTRHVAKFKSRKRDLASNNEFQNMKNKNQATNYSVFLSNKASFKYQVGYSNYNIYGAKNSNFHVTVAKNTTNRIVNIGTNSILAITVKVTAPGQKWANLTMTKNFTPTKDMIPTSIHYLILGAKNINDANVSLNMVYEKRTDPATPITVKIGYFNVNNINANVGTVLSGGAIGGIVISCVVMAIGFAISLHAVLFDLWERKAIKSATANIQAIIETANDDSMLFKIKNGEPTYGNRKLFTENFKTDTDAMIKIVDRRKIFDGPVKSTIEDQTDVMTSSRDKILKAREYYLSAKESRLLRESQEQALLETKPRKLEASSGSSLKSSSEEKGLNGSKNLSLPAFDEPVLLSRNSGATNIPKELEETAAPANPGKQTVGDQDRKLTEKEEEEARLTKLTTDTTEGKDQPSVNGAAEAGENEIILPKAGQKDNGRDADLGGAQKDSVSEPAIRSSVLDEEVVIGGVQKDSVSEPAIRSSVLDEEVVSKAEQDGNVPGVDLGRCGKPENRLELNTIKKDNNENDKFIVPQKGRLAILELPGHENVVVEVDRFSEEDFLKIQNQTGIDLRTQKSQLNPMNFVFEDSETESENGHSSCSSSGFY